MKQTFNVTPTALPFIAISASEFVEWNLPYQIEFHFESGNYSFIKNKNYLLQKLDNNGMTRRGNFWTSSRPVGTFQYFILFLALRLSTVYTIRWHDFATSSHPLIFEPVFRRYLAYVSIRLTSISSQIIIITFRNYNERWFGTIIYAFVEAHVPSIISNNS